MSRFKYPVSYKYDSVKERNKIEEYLKTIGYINTGSNTQLSYIATNSDFQHDKFIITYFCNMYNRELVENKETFKALASMREGEDFYEYEWVVLTEGKSPEPHFTIGNLYQLGGIYFKESEQKFYVISDNEGKENGCFLYNFRKATKEEIIKHFSKNETMKENKKIIGYKSPYDLFDGKIKAGSLFVPTQWNKNFYGYGDDTKTTAYSRHLPKEIVETWEAVYEETFKEVVIGTNNTKVKINQDGKVEFRGYITYIKTIKEFIKSFYGFHKGLEFYEVDIDKSQQFILIGCKHEDNRFSINELQSVVDTYEKLSS